MGCIISNVTSDKYPTMECLSWPEISRNNQGGTLRNILPVRASKVHILLQNNQTYVWYQYEIFLANHRLVGPFQFGSQEERN